MTALAKWLIAITIASLLSNTGLKSASAADDPTLILDPRITACPGFRLSVPTGDLPLEVIVLSDELISAARKNERRVFRQLIRALPPEHEAQAMLIALINLWNDGNIQYSARIAEQFHWELSGQFNGLLATVVAAFQVATAGPAGDYIETSELVERLDTGQLDHADIFPDGLLLLADLLQADQHQYLSGPAFEKAKASSGALRPEGELLCHRPTIDIRVLNRVVGSAGAAYLDIDVTPDADGRLSRPTIVGGNIRSRERTMARLAVSYWTTRPYVDPADTRPMQLRVIFAGRCKAELPELPPSRQLICLP